MSNKNHIYNINSFQYEKLNCATVKDNRNSTEVLSNGSCREKINHDPNLLNKYRRTQYYRNRTKYGSVQRVLDGPFPYSNESLDRIPVLHSLEDYDQHRIPRQGRSYLFDATTSYIDVPHSNSLGFAKNNQFTYSMWIYNNGNTGEEFIVDKQETGNLGFYLKFTGTNGILVAIPDGSSFNETSIGGALSTDTWVHLAITYDGDLVRRYENGSLVATSSSIGADPLVNSTVDMNIGRALSDAGYFDGRLRDVRLYNVVKSESQISNIYNENYTSLDVNGLIALYHMNEESGIACYDCYGSNHGIITGATLSTFHNADDEVLINPANQIGCSLGLYFDGATGYAHTSDGSYNDIGISGDIPITISAWVYINSFIDDYSPIIYFGDWSSGRACSLVCMNDGSFGLSTDDDGLSDAHSAAGELEVGQWYHLVISKDSGNINTTSLYKNGSPVALLSPDSVIPDFLIDYAYIGGSPTGHLNRTSNVIINDVQVYHAALNQGDVKNIYEYGISFQDRSDLIIHFPLLSGDSKRHTYLKNLVSNNHARLNNSEVIWHVIPRNEADIQHDVSGHNIDFLGKSPMPVQVNVPCVTFDGTDDYINFGDSDAFSFNGPSGDLPFSGSIWLNTSSFADRQGILCKDDASNIEWVFRIDSSNLEFYVGDTSEGSYIGRSAVLGDWVEVDEWFHAGFTYNGSGSPSGVKVFIDGIRRDDSDISSGSYTATENTSLTLEMGRTEASSDHIFSGSMSDARIYSTDLTESEILYLYNNDLGNRPLDKYVVAHWPMQEGATNFITDISPNENHGNIINATLSTFWGTSTNVTKDTCLTKGGSYVGWFQPSNAYIDCSTNVPQPANSLSVSFWLMSRAFTFSLESFLNYSNGGTRSVGWGFDRNASGTTVPHDTMTFWVNNFNIDAGAVHDPVDMDLNEWYHYVGTYDGSHLRLYRNGQLVTTKAYSTPIDYTGVTALELGRANHPGRSLIGYACDFRLYSNAVNSNQVRSLYNSCLINFNINKSNLIGHWTLNGNSNDLSGYGNHGINNLVEFPFISANYRNKLSICNNPKTTIKKGKFGNIYSSLDFNPYSAAELNGIGMETSYNVGDNRQYTPTENTKFRRSSVSGSRQFTAANSEYFTISDNPSLSATETLPLSIGAWIYLDSLGVERGIVTKRSGSVATSEYSLYVSSTNLITFFSSDGSNTIQVASSTVLASGKWYFVFADITPDFPQPTITVTVNRVTKTVFSLFSFPQDGANAFNIGAINGSSHFNGKISRVGLWKRLLTTQEKTLLYSNAPLYYQLSSGLRTGLVSYWDLNGLSGDARDRHGSNDLTDTNTVTFSAESIVRNVTGDDRFISFKEARTGSNLAEIEKYVREQG